VQNGTTVGDTYTTPLQSSILMGRDGNDVLTAGSGGSHLYGNSGNDILNGGKGNDLLHGGAGNDTITGGDGADTLIGGAGSDVITGGLGADVFAFHLADPGTTSARAQDTIKDFSTTQGDVLDLRDLLQGETTVTTTLDNYLSFDTTSTSGTTIIKVSPSGGGFGGGLFNPSTETERIVLEGINLRTDLGLAGNSTDAQVIAKLLEKKALVVDNG
jgi:Ca2+-binding RTX toxin-like protein